MTPVRIFRFWKTYVICHFWVPVSLNILTHPIRRPSKKGGLESLVVAIPGLNLIKINKNALIKKKRKFALILYKEIKMGSVAKSYMRKGFLIHSTLQFGAGRVIETHSF
jgi:hypothetical protein